MAPTIRTIVVDDREYRWWIPNDRIDGRETHIRIARSKTTQQLHLDPYPWELEIRPATIVSAIRVGLAASWKPDLAGAPIYLGMIGGRLQVLPPGIKFSRDAGATT